MELPSFSKFGLWIVSTVFGTPIPDPPEVQISSYEVPSGPMKVWTVHTVEGCRRGIKELLRRLRRTETSHVGLDVEWKKGGRWKAALLQLATVDGFCLLIQLHRMTGCVPKELTDFLENLGIRKVGVEVLRDCKRLAACPSIPPNVAFKPKGCLDLKYLVKDMKDQQREWKKSTPSLEDLAAHAEVPFQKDKSQTCSDWELDCLHPVQQMYAAQDAVIGAKIFSKLYGNVNIDNAIDQKYSNKNRSRMESSPACDDDKECDGCGILMTVKQLRAVKAVPVEYEKLLPAPLKNWDTSMHFCGKCQLKWFERQRETQRSFELLLPPGNRDKHSKAIVAYHEDKGLVKIVQKFVDHLYNTAQELRGNHIRPLPNTWPEDVYQKHLPNIYEYVSSLSEDEREDVRRRIFGTFQLVDLPEMGSSVRHGPGQPNGPWAGLGYGLGWAHKYEGSMGCGWAGPIAVKWTQRFATADVRKPDDVIRFP
ncbi:uncharacterized protein LOC122370006 [Amphibalanus amphitrite]|uniref:uncharacterized protein LOC122370006 n=1 Tax=Amphibalanus amphitrite TaxID=1232801 RepID=UPI001C8FE2F0|nr:uncharacterized protein LOC122370006 [Amphibalanus amphitrite]